MSNALPLTCTECFGHTSEGPCEQCSSTGFEPCKGCCCRPRRAATHIDPCSGDPICEVCSYAGACTVCLDPQTTIAGIAYGDRPACEACLAMARNQERQRVALGRAA